MIWLFLFLFWLSVLIVIAMIVYHKKKEKLYKIDALQKASLLIPGSQLPMLFKIHKMLGRNNLCNNPFLKPNIFGEFRTNNIVTMDESEVFLGNIHGFWTYSLPYWESCKDEDAVEIVTNQYRQLLQQGIEYELSKLKK